MRTHYEVLGVRPDAGPEEILRAYRAAARRAHPDMGGMAEEFSAVSAAWEVLGKPEARAAYDLTLETADAWSTGWGRPVDSMGATTSSPSDPDTSNPPSADDTWEAGWGTSEAERDSPETEPTTERHGRLDPFVGGPVPLPPVTPPPLARFVDPWWLGPLFVVAAVSLVLSTGPLMVFGLSPTAGWLEAFLGVLVAAVAVSLVAIALSRWRTNNSIGSLALMLIGAVAGGKVAGSLSGVAELLTFALFVLIVLSAAALLEMRGRRRSEESRMRMLQRHGMAVDAMRETRQRAEQWNVVRAQAAKPGNRIVRVGKPVRNSRHQHRVRDAATGRRRVQHFASFVATGSWVVVDDSGVVTAFASGRAPRDWSTVLAWDRRAPAG